MLYGNIGESVDFGFALDKANKVVLKLMKAEREAQIAEELILKKSSWWTEISYSDSSAIVKLLQSLRGHKLKI